MIDVLRYWHMEEFLLPQILDAPYKLNEKNQQSFRGSLDDMLDKMHKLASENIGKEHKKSWVWEFYLYGGLYKIENIKKNLLDILGAKDDFEERVQNGLAASYVLVFGHQLKFQTDGVQFSTAPWAMKDIAKHKKLTHLDYICFESIQTGYTEKLNDVSTEETYNFEEFVRTRDKELKEILGEVLLDTDEFQLIAKKKHLENVENASNDSDLLNSFYIEDINKTIKYLKDGNTNNILESYLEMDEHGDRVDIRKNIEYVYEKLQPTKLPKACWATSGGYPLVYSQQFAINAIQERLFANGGIYAVNGPPGTGKTTMLRDLIASIVTERAIKIAMMKDSKEMFGSKKSIWKIDDKYQRHYYPLNEDMRGYEIVVASSNNGAVENVTKEIPAIDSIDSLWLDEIDFFKEIGSGLIDTAAWGSGAAPLGNSSNKSKFVGNYWFKSKEKNDEYDGFHVYLKNIQSRDKEQRIKKWREAKKIFIDALREVERDTEKKEKLLRDEKEAKKKVLENRKKLEEIKISLDRFKNKVPTLWEKILDYIPFRKTFQQRIRNKIEQYQFEVMRCNNNLQDEEKTYDKIKNLLDDALKYSDDDAKREKSSPWIHDEEYQQKRTQVFISAMNLHKATIDVNAEQMHTNLMSMMDVLQNKVGKNTSYSEAVLHLWGTLFLTVPVVSTTFASFGRLFSHLWDSKIGWLLIDEAGQASAKAAVGAIMRSQRVVVVGDPLQLEPIVGLPSSVQSILHKEIKAHDMALSDFTSVQKRADFIEHHGTILESDEENSIWVGSPLRVHRRCNSPMFDISNVTTYKGLMVQGKEAGKSALPSSCWIDVPSVTNNGHWIEEEGIHAEQLVRELIYKDVDKDDIYLISPFRDVVKGLTELFESNKLIDVKKRVGTIHTVQGKEAKVVILVLGSDPKNEGARAWAALKPNLLNVAVTRAKEKLYIIGNKDKWKDKQYFSDAVRLLN